MNKIKIQTTKFVSKFVFLNIVPILIFTGCSSQESVSAEKDCLKIKSAMEPIDSNDPNMMELVSSKFKTLWINLDDPKLIETVRSASQFDPFENYDIQQKVFDDNLIAIFSYCNENTNDEFFGN